MTETFWVTKFALTKGLEKMDCVVTEDGQYATQYAGSYRLFAKIGVDAHRSELAARIRVIDMISAQLKSLEKRKLKLEKLHREMRASMELSHA